MSKIMLKRMKEKMTNKGEKGGARELLGHGKVKENRKEREGK